MKIDNVKYPKSSFLAVEKDLELVVNKIIANERLKKYLYYTDNDPLSHPKLTQEQTLSLFGKNIKIVPKMYIDREVLNYIIIRFTGANETSNPQFRSNYIEFDIITHFGQWNLKDFQMRPYRIAAELDSMFNDQYLTGMGKLQYAGAAAINTNDEYGGICLRYFTVHGAEDQKYFPDPREDVEFEKDFREMVNNLK